MVKEGLPIDFAIVSPALGNLSGPDWLVFGVFQGNPIRWLAGAERISLLIPKLEFEKKSKLEAISIKDLKQSNDVRGSAEVLSARSKSKSGCLQSFRFVTMEDEDHNRLRMTLESLRNQALIGSSKPGDWQLP